MKPKIFIFKYDPTQPLCVAMAEDGDILQGHNCFTQNSAPADLGMIPGLRAHRHDAYTAKYPDGYELVFVPLHESGTNTAFVEAFTKHMNRVATYDLCGLPEAKADASKHMNHFNSMDA